MTDIEDVGLRAALRNFGELVRCKRQACRWYFRELAEKTGIDIVKLSDVEQGVDALTDIERETLCEFFGIDIDAFPKMLRNERRKAASENAETPDGLRSAPVVDLTRYRESWQKITTLPRD
ncbi:helix-turn-helix transcriptional regulator [Rhizobium leguminosarum]|uniref:helix-turn-helix domain-containing protein n=1 Tax=Rhizobium leguminosarum TaxID=384 RepID=UPI001C975B84|nr:helix-turn-helix domain-containing protein [Rhizobium leguminosarum]MBY5650655.1 helix-turn-helix transcriptional regulator [Rhizobium leguminosarum]